MNSEPLVSVIIPTVPSRHKELKRAVKSIGRQTHKNIELIIICDNTITSPAACNQGLFRANGKYIAFLGDDDTWKKDKIKLQVEVFEKDSRCILCSCWLRDYRFNMWRINKPQIISSYKDILKAFNYSSGSTYMIRNTKGILQFDESLLSGQEYDFALRLLKHTKNYAVCIPKLLVNQYSTPGQISTNWSKKIRGIWQLAKKHGKDYEIMDWVKVVGLLGLYFSGFFFGTKIYKLITIGKEMHE